MPADPEPSELDRLIPLVYSELRRIADAYLKRERQSHTLQPTALVHEAYLRLAQGATPTFQNRAHFYGIAAQVMRQILVDHARRRNAGKRADGLSVPLEEALIAAPEKDAGLIAVDDALTALEQIDASKARLLEMRFFVGLTAEESAEVLSLPVQTVRGQLRIAQAWMRRELDRNGAAGL